MKWLALRSCVLIAALPLYTTAAILPHAAAAAQPRVHPADIVFSYNFAVVPGRPLLMNQRPQFAFNLLVTPGQAIHDIVAVVNGSRTTPLSVTLAVGDAVTPLRGAGLSFHDTGIQQQIGLWTQLNSIRVTVPPRQAAYVPITLSVPAGVRPGDYEGSVSATTVSGFEFTQGNIHNIIHITRRCLIYVRVAGRASAGLRIVRASMPIPNRASFSIALQNTGTLIATPIKTVMAFKGLKKTYTVKTSIGTVVGGAFTTVSYDLSKLLPGGTYTASIAITYQVRPTYSGPYQKMETSWTGTVVVP